LVTTGTPKQSGIPCAMVLTAYLVLTSERPGFVVSVAARIVDPQDLAPATGAPGPHALAVRIPVARLATRTRPSHPAPNVRGDREAPLSRARDAERQSRFPKTGRRIFLREGLDRANQLDFVRENGFSAHAPVSCPLLARAKPRAWRDGLSA